MQTRFSFAVMALALALALALAGSARAVTLFQVDKFDAGVAGWSEGSATPNAPQVADTGLSGGAYLSNASGGGGGPGSRMMMWNDAQWTGDFMGTGVVGIEFDARSVGVQPIDFRFAFSGSGGWFMSPSIRIDDFAPGPDLTSFFLPITAADLTHVSGGSGIYADTMGGVSRMEIISATGTPAVGISASVLQGDILNATLWVDNIRAIPEPGGAWLIATGLLALALRRRRGSRPPWNGHSSPSLSGLESPDHVGLDPKTGATRR